MAIYLIVLFYLVLGVVFELFHANIKASQKKVCYWIIAFTLFAIAGFRYGLEQDYWHYYYVFHGITTPPALEIGFKFLNAVVRVFTSSFSVYCVIVALISVGIKTCWFSKFKYPFVILLVYYLRFYVLLELNAIRQGLAMSLIIVGMYYLIKGERKKYLIITFLAMLIHSSAICGFIGLLLNNQKIKLKNLVLIYLICILFRLMLFEPVLMSFSPYVSVVTSSSNTFIRGIQYLINSWDKILGLNPMSFIRVIIPGVCLYIMSDKKENMLYYNLYFTGSILNVLFWGLDTIAIRIPVVLYIFEGQIINNALINNRLFGHKKSDLIFTFCLMCVMFCDVWTFVSYLTDSLTLVPYQSILGILF